MILGVELRKMRERLRKRRLSVEKGFAEKEGSCGGV